MSKKKKHHHSGIQDTLREAQSLSERQMRFPLKTAGFVFGGTLLAAVFFFYSRFVRPELIHFHQQPVFFADRAFLAERLQVPGGFLDFIAAFLTELYRAGWPGSLILSGLGLTVCLLLFRLLKPGRWWLAAVLPAVLLIMAQARYDTPVVKTLSVILGLEAFILLRDIAGRNRAVGTGTAIAALVPLYWLSPAAGFLFAALAILRFVTDSSMNVPGRIASAAGIAAASAFIPWAGAKWVYYISERNAFLRHSPFWRTDVFGSETATGFPWDGAAVAAILILAAIAMIAGKTGEDGRTATGQPRPHAIQAAASILLIVICGRFAVDPDQRAFLAVRHAAHTGKWNEVMERMTGPAARFPICLFHFNRALYHSGSLASDFFRVPGNFSGTGLFPDRDSRFQAPLDCSDLYDDLGHVNEAKRWAFEALTLYGESADVLKRLVVTHIVSGQDSVAARILDKLSRNPFASRWADRQRKLLHGSGERAGGAVIAEKAGKMPETDFIVDSRKPGRDMEKLAASAPDNRMAIEYLLMSDLLDRDLEAFSRNLIRYRSSLPDPLPVLYEEGLIAALSTRRAADPRISSITVRKTTLDRFSDFERILKAHGIRSGEAARDLGRSHAATYWYYLLYSKPAE